MTRYVLLSVVATLLTVQQSFSQWVQKKDFPGKGAETTAFAVGPAGYILTGDSTHNFWRYDTTGNAWTELADFPGIRRTKAVAFAIGDIGYIGTGQDPIHAGQVYNDFWAYNVTSNSWLQRDSLPANGRTEAFGFSIGNMGYLGGGGLNDFWAYDPTKDAWTQKANIAMGAVRFPAAFAIGNKGYVGTGDTGGTSGPSKEFWEYNPANDIWTKMADFGGGPRGYATGFAVGGKGYIGTGYEMYGGEKADLWEYTPSTNTWTQKENMGSSGRYQSQGLAIGSKGFIGLGNNSGTGHGESVPQHDFWQYAPTKVSTGIADDIQNIIRFYPNPGSDKLYYNATGEIRITDMLGNLVYSSNNTGSEQMVELGDFSNGIYMVSVINKKQAVTKKLIINK